MIEEQAKVSSILNGEIYIEASRHSACGQCASKDNCGQSSIAQWASSKMVDILVANPQQLSISKGSQVIVGIDEKSFLKASVLLYILPLVFMFTAGALSTFYGLDEWLVILLSLIGLIVGFVMIKGFAKKMEQSMNYQPMILKVLSK